MHPLDWHRKVGGTQDGFHHIAALIVFGDHAVRLPKVDSGGHGAGPAFGRCARYAVVGKHIGFLILANANRVLSRDQLLMHTRNREWEPFDRSIDIRIARLRRKIEPDPERPRLIRTVRSAGYMYVPA